jgi:hypothetical protein
MQHSFPFSDGYGIQFVSGNCFFNKHDLSIAATADGFTFIGYIDYLYVIELLLLPGQLIQFNLRCKNRKAVINQIPNGCEHLICRLATDE